MPPPVGFDDVRSVDYPPAMPFPWPSTIGAVSVLLCFVFAARAMKRRRLLDAVPTSKIRGVFLGLTEVKAKAHRERPLVGYLSNRSCVWYSYEVSEKWSRTVTETTTDSEGRTRTTTRTESGWHTLDEETRAPAFELVDETGSIRIVPDRAKIEPTTVFSETCRRSDPLYYDKGPRRSIPNSDHVRRFVEKAIPLGAKLYVLGSARLRKDGLTPEIGWQKPDKTLLISMRTEEKIQHGLGIQFGILFVLGGILAGLSGAFLTGSPEEAPDFFAFLANELPSIAIAVGSYALAMSIWHAIQIYNGIVHLRQRVRNALSQIDIQLQRRHVLIPRLVTVVKAYAKHEAETLRELTEQRAAAGATAASRKPDVDATERDARAQIETFDRLIGVAEAYPELHANAQYRALLRSITSTENGIAHAREFFNDSVMIYNRRIESFPDVAVAKITGSRRAELLRFDTSHRAEDLLAGLRNEPLDPGRQPSGRDENDGVGDAHASRAR